MIILSEKNILSVKQKTAVKKSLNYLINYLFYILGSIIYAIGYAYFVQPNKISPGGITGVASVLAYLTSIPTGILYFAINIPIIILGFIKVGGKFTLRTLSVTVIVSFFIDTFVAVLPEFKGERLLAAIFGGLLMGLGLALIMLRGATSGGTDVLAKVIRQKFPFFSMGRIVLALDAAVAIFAATVYKNIETALFTVITVFVSSRVLDALLYGLDDGRMLFVITDNPENVAKALFFSVERGITKVNALGAYSGENRNILICALRINQVDKAVKAIKSADENAFTVVALTGGVFGSGFEKKTEVM